jgi:hypothetical protein
MKEKESLTQIQGKALDLKPSKEWSLPLDRIDPAAVAAAEAAKARIQSAYLYAMHNPRDFDSSRDKILTACRRPAFAEKVEYVKPVGQKKIRGPSARFAELAMREWRNVLTETSIIYEDTHVRRLHVLCIDLETNTQHGQELAIEKTVERKKPTEDREIISERTNTKGEKVYVVAATEDELFNKQNAMISKIKRNEGLRLIPTDIIDEAVEIARETIKNEDAKDPSAAKKKILDSFSEIGVKPNMIKQFLGHSLDDVLAPAELGELRRMYRAITDGEAKWKDYMEKGEEGEKEAPELDTEAIAKFDAFVAEQKDLDLTIFNGFLEDTAKVNEMTIDQLKAEIIKSPQPEIKKFWDGYAKHAEMARKPKAK